MSEVKDSEDKGMGSDGENLEDRQEDLETQEMGLNASDVDHRGSHSKEMVSKSQATRGGSVKRFLISSICTGEKEIFYGNFSILLSCCSLASV